MNSFGNAFRIVWNKLRGNGGFLSFIVVLLLVRTTLANQYVVPTGSMIPNLRIGDVIFVDRTAYDLKLPFSHVSLQETGAPNRGEIVVFDSVEEPGMVLVKRLIGLPGDRVDVIDGQVWINGEKVSLIETAESDGETWRYKERLPGGREFSVQRLPNLMRPERLHFDVPAGHYFMMGDNRDNSHDGRRFGFVPREKLIGRANRVLYSRAFDWSRFGLPLEP